MKVLDASVLVEYLTDGEHGRVLAAADRIEPRLALGAAPGRR